MAKKVQEELAPENISVESLDSIMGDKYAVYAKYVIQDRAIPDVRDGLKPVQRRIIYSMYQNGNTYDKQTKKCAKIVGDVMGRFHPHGDSSIYEALVRMSQPWKMSEPLVIFQGNNGSIDNDPAAAYRYTEAKLNEFSENLISDIDKNTVDMTLNFDDTEFEPVVLPCRFPNLYVNGSDGIAVAIATQIPPHNLGEICDAVIYRIQHPNCSLDELLEIVHGPDFPTGGIIYKSQGIRDIYETGRGKIEIASKLKVDTSNKNYNEIVISEIPYGVVKQSLVFSIDKIKKSHEIDGINEVKDLSSGDEIEIVIETKKEVDPQIIIAYLMNKTQLKVSYSSNIVAICDKHPRTLSLISYLDYYIAFQVDVITRRTNFLLKKAKDRLHIVEGLIKAISIINEVVQLIRKSKDKADAKLNLQKTFGFTEPQSEAIVSMRLYRLTNTDVTIYVDEKNNLIKQISDYEETLANPNKLKKIIISDLKAIVKEFGQLRRSIIEEKEEEVQIDKRDLIAKEDVYVVVTRDGYIKRSSLKSYKSSNGALPGVKVDDSIVMAAIVNTVDYVLCFTNKGNYILLPVHEILEGKWKDEGKHINYICNLPLKESIIKCIAVKDFNIGVSICTVSKLGQIKKTPLIEFYSQRINKPICCMKLTNSDEMSDVCVLKGNTNVLIMTKAGKATYFNENDIADTRLKTSGVKCIATLSDSSIESITPFELGERCKLLFLTNLGMCKILDSNTLNLRHRLEKSDMLLKSFKTEIHDLLTVRKVTNSTQEIVMDCVLDNSSSLRLTFNDFHVTPLEKYCRKNIDELPDGRKISFVYTYDVECVDQNTKVTKKKARPQPKPVEETSEVKVVKIDYEGEIEQELNDDEGKVEQISIFDDMGD